MRTTLPKEFVEHSSIALTFRILLTDISFLMKSMLLWAAEGAKLYIDFIDKHFYLHITIALRMFRFAGYPATQYYILEKQVYHECLESEGGSGLTAIIESGPLLYAKKHWRYSLLNEIKHFAHCE